ncbi:MAG: hypothetical protein ACLP8S_23545 [Solirubrobacteraceae bacterium]
MEFLIVLAILLAIVLAVTAPLRRAVLPAHRATSEVDTAAFQRIELEAAQEAKYREIRDTELDHRTGKLSDADYAAIDATLRAEAIEILHELDRARASEGVDS